jgi:UDP-glucose 4-epimerase
LVRVLGSDGHDVVGLDVLESPQTSVVGSIVDRQLVRRHMTGVDAVIHSATLHQPHIASHDSQAFVDANVSGTLNLLDEAVAAGVRAFVYTSTTSVFGRALRPPQDEPAAWSTEEVRPVPRNIYGVTKAAAEDLCELAYRDLGLPCVVLRTSRFFPEDDDQDDLRSSFDGLNLKVNELLYRRVDLDDVVTAHRLALERAGDLGFGRYIISATSPFTPGDLAALRSDAPAVVRRLFPDYSSLYEGRGWRMLPSIDRVYVNASARTDLGWSPRYDFRFALDRLRGGDDPRSPLALSIGQKGYHVGRQSR